MVSSRSASRGQLTNSRSSSLSSLIVGMFLRHLLRSFAITKVRTTNKRIPIVIQTHIGQPIIPVIIFPE
jgi:hypothetical protein